MTLSPNQQLHIYYFEGCIHPESELLFNDTYIGNWEEDKSSFLFFKKSADHDISNLKTKQPDLTLIDYFQMSYEELCGGMVLPLDVGPFMISYPWEKAPDTHDKISILLDPGVVFGAGTHQTTYDCLRAIDYVCQMHPIDSMMDLGTGTGILSIAGARLGINRIIAVDLNPLAAKTTLNNIKQNQLNKQVVSVQGNALQMITQPVDLLIANIHYEIMSQLISHPSFLEKKYFILSGLLPSESQNIFNKLSQLPVDILKRWDNHWVTCMGWCNPI